MSKTFRPWDVDQVWLLPPSIQDLVPGGHVAHFVRDTVRTGLDLSAIMDTYTEERGYPPYHPGMMVALLLYAYSQGVYSSRRIARACEERLDFAAVTGLQHPDFRTISDFRKRHLKALAGLFQQVLKLCRGAGLVKLGHVALDGTKIKANLGINPEEVSADAGYCSQANLLTLSRRRIEAYVATGRQKHGTKAAVTKRSANKPLIVQMSTKLKRGGYRSRYRLRKQIVEPVFGQIKQARGFRQFLLRGIEQVQSEWAMLCIAHNLCKLAGAR